MKKTYTVEDGKIRQHVEGMPTPRETDLQSFTAEFGKWAPFNTGWMPPGLRMYTQAGPRSQAIIECQPGINLTWWGKYERDVRAKLYELAQPYRVIIADFINNVFYGARMFYSPVPINGPDTQLYHANVPNLNCRGYGGNGVGWICLYHQNLVQVERPLGEKLAQVIERCSGAEAYNDANMSETDGPRFYRGRDKPDYLWNPVKWEEKSLAEGFEWTLDSDMWIPIMVKDVNHQGSHYDKGVPLTIGMAAEGQYMAYYSDSTDPTPAQLFRQGKDFDAETIFNTTFNGYQGKNYGNKVAHSLPTEPHASAKPKNSVTCIRCSEMEATAKLGDQDVCKKCLAKDRHCTTCNKIKRSYAFVSSDLCKLCHNNQDAVAVTAVVN